MIPPSRMRRFNCILTLLSYVSFDAVGCGVKNQKKCQESVLKSRSSLQRLQSQSFSICRNGPAAIHLPGIESSVARTSSESRQQVIRIRSQIFRSA
jgi:hypothetical protein